MDEYYCYPGQPDQIVHDENHLFCDDMSCPCHEDNGNMETMQSWYDEGLIGAEDGDNIYHGRTI